MSQQILTKIGQSPVSAVQLARHLEEGSLCPCELLEVTLANIKSADPTIFTQLLEERAREEAHASRQRRREGKPLSAWDGIPIAWKDLFDIKNRVTTAGSFALKSNPPATHDADIVTHATKAGLVSVGCLNMTEFAYSGLGLNPHFGTPINPHSGDTPHIPGGSSSGCGVAVAQGLVPLAIGSDMGGSIRIPAALNGVVGYKGSSTAFPSGGVFPLSTSLDTFGPLASDVASCIGVADILNGRKISMPMPIPIESLNFFIPTNIVFNDIQDDVAQNFENSVRILTQAGAKVTRGVMQEFDDILALNTNHGYLAGPEALDLHWNLVHSPQATQIDPRIFARLTSAGEMTARDYVFIQRQRAKLIAKNLNTLGNQIVLFPTTPITAPALAPLEQDDALYVATNKLMLRNTAFGNFLDWCGVALPNGKDHQQLPTSILLSMPTGQDYQLLAVALAVEKLLNPHF